MSTSSFIDLLTYDSGARLALRACMQCTCARAVDAGAWALGGDRKSDRACVCLSMCAKIDRVLVCACNAEGWRVWMLRQDEDRSAKRW